MLETTWFVIWGLAWAIYFMLDGFDLGLGAMMPFLAKDDVQKRIVINAMGPFWDGNEVWLITAGGVTFAAFPLAYSVMFSSLYTPLMVLLFALILRGVAFEFRGKEDRDWWRNTWDACLIFGSAAPAVIFGVFFANIFRGIPIDSVGRYQGSLLALANPYALLGGVASMLIFSMHGTLWLATRTKNEMLFRAVRLTKRLWPWAAAASLAFAILTAFETRLWRNLLATPLLLALPIAGIAGLFMARVFLARGHYWRAWFSSAAMILTSALSCFLGLFPDMLISSLDPAATLNVFNSASSPLSLKIMLIVAIAVLPVVIGYQIWVHLLFRDAVTEKSISSGPAY